ncbi:MAG TPA: hypothetical protein VF188_08420 [Longimicrobiales bacterium]
MSDWDTAPGGGGRINRAAWAAGGAAGGAIAGYFIGGRGRAGVSGNRWPPATRMDLITLDEIRTSGAGTAYQLVKALRPEWLQARGAQSLLEIGSGARQAIAVYLDGTYLGGLDALREISAADLVSAQFVDARTATMRWGARNSHGAIVLRTRPAR